MHENLGRTLRFRISIFLLLFLIYSSDSVDSMPPAQDGCRHPSWKQPCNGHKAQMEVRPQARIHISSAGLLGVNRSRFYGHLSPPHPSPPEFSIISGPGLIALGLAGSTMNNSATTPTRFRTMSPSSNNSRRKPVLHRKSVSIDGYEAGEEISGGVTPVTTTYKYDEVPAITQMPRSRYQASVEDISDGLAARLERLEVEEYISINGPLRRPNN